MKLWILALFTIASYARAEAPRVQDLEVSDESRMSFEEFQRLAATAPKTNTFGGGTTTAGNYPNTVTAANYPDTITAANYPDTVTEGNYPNTVTASNYPFVVNGKALAEMPAPQLAQ